MKFIGLSAFFVLLFAWILIGADWNTFVIGFFLDAPSLMGVIGIPVAVALICGDGDILFPSIKAVFSKTPLNARDNERALRLFKLMRKTTLVAAALMALASVVLILGNLSDVYALGANVALAVLPFFYAIIINLALIYPAIQILSKTEI